MASRLQSRACRLGLRNTHPGGSRAGGELSRRCCAQGSPPESPSAYARDPAPRLAKCTRQASLYYDAVDG